MIKRINAFAEWLSQPLGFFLLNMTWVVGLVLQWCKLLDENLFTLYLSIIAIVVTSFVLVAQRRDSLAVNLKMDALIVSSEANNRAIGAEHRDVKEIEADLKEIEDTIE